MEFVEKAKVVLELEDEEPRVSLESLKSEAREINKELRNMKESGQVGSEAWKELKERQREVNAELKEFTSNIDLNDASMNELTARSRQLQSELNKLKIGSDEWIAKLEELNTVNGIIAEAKDAAKNFGKVIEDNAQAIDLNTASMDQLQAHSKLLHAQLNQLKIGSDEWLDKLDEIQKVDGMIDNAKAAMKGFGNEIDLNSASFSELQAHAKKLESELHQLTVGSDEWIEKLKELNTVNGRIESVEKQMKDLGYEVDKQESLWDKMKTSAVGVFTGSGLLDLAQGLASQVMELGKEIFETTAKFEKYEAVLKNSLGSQEAASAAIGDIKKFAAETPFSVDELTESYVKYINRGIQPSMEEMRKLGDIAASQGKSFDQLTEAVLDAATGEFERLKEFGIQASKSGDQVELSFKGVQKTVANTPESIQAALLSFGELEGVVGGMAAISQTLEGRVSNLGDNFDTLKLTIGEGLKPVFGLLIDAMNWGISVVQDLFTGTNPLSKLFDSLGDIFGRVWDSAVSLFESWMDGAKSSGFLQTVIDNITFSLKAVATAFLAGLTAINVFMDGLNAVINKGKEVANFFGSNFKIDPKANFDTLAKNAQANFDSIKKMWSDTNTANVATTTATNAKIQQEHAKTQDTMTDKEKKELEKKQKEKEKQLAQQKKADDKLRADTEKAEKDLDKKLETMRIKAIADEKKRKVEEINFKYKQEADAIKNSIASETKKNDALEKLEKERINEIDKAEAEFRKKKDDEDKKLRDKTAAEEKKLRDERLKESKALFDAEFSAEVAKAQNTLDLTKKNSAEMWDAKRNLLETEWRYKQQQLANEAAAEKARIQESISDTDQRRIALENIDSKLKAKLSTEEQKFQQDKTKLNEEQNKQREENNKKFFEGLDAAMKGDFTSFMKFLADKVKNDKDANLKKLQDFSEKTQQISDAASQGIETLKKLNQQFLESQLQKITAEKNAQLESWQKQYDSGKITKEQFEAEKDKINTQAAAKERQARKDAFEREKKMNIAQAVINTAQAALKSFAMFGWPIGAIMAALAAVAGGIQVANISRQKFEGRVGGVVNSEGKVFARSGASIPRNAFVSQGDSHGSKYGEAGIAMINRRTGQEVGEIEGGEPVMVLSRNTYKNNGPIVDKLLRSSMYQNGAPITMANGGILTASGNRMYADGGTIDTGSTDGSGGGSSSSSITPANTDAMMEESKKSAKDMAEIKQNTADMRDLLKNSNNQNFKLTNLNNNQIVQIARAFMDVFNDHTKVFKSINSIAQVSKELLEDNVTKLNDIDKSQRDAFALVVSTLRKQLDFAQKHSIDNKTFWNAAIDEIMQQHQDLFDEGWKLKRQLHDAKTKSENEWRAEQKNLKATAIMLQRYILSELQAHGQKLDQIRDKPTGTGDILHTLGRIEANTAKSNLK
ncbi:MAG: hypothetical protein ACOVQ4_06880 [Flectobacillus sp.]|uniref:hypothetical protein n=1 Tax=Flectobacillus sp. TaxID=50419 RepID=UPI003B9C3B1E